MEYEGSIGLVSRKMKIFYCFFHVLGLFMAKKHDLSKKKIRLSRDVAVERTPTAFPLKARKLKFRPIF
jgi:hypothetical protein